MPASPPSPPPAATERVQIKHRFDDSRVLFEREVAADLPTWGLKLGAAIKLAVNARANLADANLAGANLAGANLADAYLARANLARANLAGANLADAYLARANLARAEDIIRIDCGHGWPLILRNGDPVMAGCGCRWMTVADLRKHWQRHSDDQRRTLMLPALDAAVSIAKAKGWTI